MSEMITAIGTTTYMFMWSANDDEPSDALLNAVHRGEWTEGGMAEAGWLLSDELSTGAPVFRRLRVETDRD